ncbi:hypothetical protein [Donghicola sp. XS_ASV15]|uniref:hypothetical protein n=1 Tax=Donghicola sp. XS_ASV15 TaxID=3241295 RepID=UPI003519BD04
MRLALIEDDDLHAEVVGRWMGRDARVQFNRFHTATEFLSSMTELGNSVPDVVLVDYYLSDGTANEFVRDLRSLGDERADIGVVLISGVDIVEFSRILEGLDVDGFVLKDDLSRERLTMVASLAMQSSKRRQELSALKK